MGVVLVEFQGRFFKLMRAVVGLLRRFSYRTPERSAFTEPAVYVCRHSDNDGPVISLANLPLPVHPWAYHVWCDWKECYKQCVEYTFTARYGWSERKAKIVASLIARPFTALIRSAGCIPVYRNSSRIRETFKESVEALKRGESLLIFPDVDYSSQEGDTGALYDGFLMLERLYFRETGKHLPFVPMRIDYQNKALELDEAVSFGDDAPFMEEKKRVIRALHEALNKNGESAGD